MYELHTLDQGAGDQPVLLLHAFPCDHTLYEAQIPELVGAGYRVLAPDLPGFGRSAVPAADPDLAFSAQAVFDLLDDRSLSQASVVGLSMGGYVAMEMLRHQPGRIVALGLLDTKASQDAPAAIEGRLAMAERVLAEDSSSALLPLVPGLIGTTTADSRPEVVGTVEAFVSSADPAGIAWSQRAMAARPDSIPALQQFHGPALVVRGSEDSLSSQDDTDAMAAALSRSSNVTIPECGHLSAIEMPQELTAALLGFLDGSVG